MPDIDDRGSFYLGRPHDLATGQTAPTPLLYDSADLTTHAVCVGMTGSGKTGLCLTLLEEAALDGIPAIAIDPKGDLGNLLLTFPELRGADFRPWIDDSQATREDVSPDALAQKTADLWRQGLTDWDQNGARIRRFKDAVDCAIYTPGSSAGLPLSVLKSLHAPSAEVQQDTDAFADYLMSATSSLLGLVGIESDPVNGREHILLSTVLQSAWSKGRDVNLQTLPHEVKDFRGQIGSLPLDSFMPSKDRDALAFSLNSLTASPAFAGWREGEPLDIQRLLYTAAGKPRLSILSIAHLGEQERMFFVTLLLNELVSWMRAQPGTSNLRAVLYMDEVFGYFPPSANPPAKRPMLTLLKQARAYGVGCVLATQNPVDLDYKGLSNAGTWFLGRLQTERDKLRVLEGLEGASAEAGAQFDRSEMDRLLAALGKRVFLMKNVHDPAATIFHTRWALSYLAGPLTRGQIGKLMAERKRAAAPVPGAEAETVVFKQPAPTEPIPGADADTVVYKPTTSRPLLSGDVVQRFWPVAGAGGDVTYQPALLGRGQVHFVQPSQGLDLWQRVFVLKAVDGALSPSPWEGATVFDEPPALVDEPAAGAVFAELPGMLGQPKSYTALKRELDQWLFQTQRYQRVTCDELGESAHGDETEAEFRRRAAPLLQAARRKRAVEQFAAVAEQLDKEIAAAEAERAEHRWWFFSLFFNAASRAAEILITGLFGRRSRKQIMTQTVWKQAMRSRTLAAQAKKSLKEKTSARQRLQTQHEDELRLLDVPLPPAVVPIKKLDVASRKSDVDVDEVVLVWLPWRTADDRRPAPAYTLPSPSTNP